VVRCFRSSLPFLQYLLLHPIYLVGTNLVAEFLINCTDDGLRLISRILHNLKVHVVAIKSVDRFLVYMKVHVHFFINEKRNKKLYKVRRFSKK
jgi:hypothetical protein